MDKAITEKNLHLTFEISIILKGLHAILEMLGGVLFFFGNAFLMNWVSVLALDELSEDKNDVIANYALKLVSNISVSTEHFVALYLFSHGIIKLAVIVGLLQQKKWAYPTSIFVFLAFIAYQLYRYSHTHSPWLIVFTVFDLFVILLTVHEWRYRKKFAI